MGVRTTSGNPIHGSSDGKRMSEVRIAVTVTGFEAPCERETCPPPPEEAKDGGQAWGLPPKRPTLVRPRAAVPRGRA